MSIVRLTHARYEAQYRVWLRFSDGLEGTVDLEGELHGEMFEPLRDLATFARVRLDPAIHTLVWSNGADLAPEHLHDLLLATKPTALTGLQTNR